ncbi:MAG: T9SS type A sorting domain-containing protein [bacterium]
MKKILVFLSLLLIFTVNCLSQDFWERVNVPNDSPVMEIAQSQTGELFAASVGAYKSIDNAESWMGINKTEFQGLTLDLFEMYIYLRSVLVAKDSTVYINMGDGIAFKSEDSGNNWIPLMDGPQNIYNIVEDDSGRLFALKYNGLYYSDDKGITWIQVEGIIDEENDYIRSCKMSITPWGDLFIPIKGTMIKRLNSEEYESSGEGLDSAYITCYAFKDNIVYAGAGDKRGLFFSNDSGKTWAQFESFPENINITALAFNDAGVFFAGTDSNGVCISNDNGLTWEQNSQIPNQEIYSIKSIGDKVYICTNGLYVSDDGTNWTLKNNGLSYPGVGAHNFNSQSNHYAITYFNFFKSDDNCVTWNSMDLPFDFRYTSFFLIDNEDNMYAASFNDNWFYYSTDYGTSWGDVNDLVQNLGITINDVISLAMNSKGDIYLAFDAGESIWKSTDNGHSWVFFMQDDMASRLFIGNNDELLIYNPMYGSKLSKDDGASWININMRPAIDDYEQPHHILVDGNLIFSAGSQTGFYISTDNGETWENKNEGIAPNFEEGPEGSIEIFKIQYLNGIIYIATGSGIYYSDNLADTWQPLNSGTVRAKAGDFLFKKDNHLYVTSLSGVYRSVDEIVDVEDGLLSVGNVNFKIFPNPVKDLINIDAIGNPEGKIRITLFDLSGNKLSTLFDGYCQNGNIQIPIKHIISGSYFLKLESNCESVTTVLKVIR